MENIKIPIILSEREDKEVFVTKGSKLSEEYDTMVDEILFGCRTGICGTCAILVESNTELPPPTETEQEFFESMGLENQPGLRLACQFEINQPVRIKKLEV